MRSARNRSDISATGGSYEAHFRHRVIAINLYGYGKTEPWRDGPLQTLADQAYLLKSLIQNSSGPMSLVGHSFGGSVAMKAAALFKNSIQRLVLIEPNPFYLLEQHTRHDGFREACTLRDAINLHYSQGDGQD